MPLSGFIEDVFKIGEYGLPKAFVDACPASANTRSMQARTDELERSWEPTGYYTWQEMSELLAAAVEMSGRASSAAIQAFQENPTDVLRKASDEYIQIVRKANEDYLPIWKRAQATNAPINAPGFKRWVISLLRASHKLMRMSEISVCLKPWWLGAIQGFMFYFNKVADIAQSIGRVVVKAGQAVVDAADTVIGLFPVVKWGALGLGALFLGVYLWNRLQYTAEAGRRPFDWSSFRRLFQRPNSTRKLLR